MDKYQRTFNTWNKVVQLYEDKFMDLDLYNDTYDTFCDLLKKQSPHILEIGCGPGNITKYLLGKRPDFNILATDVSQNMIDKAKINNPIVQIQKLDARDILGIKNKFDAVMSGFCLPYLSREDIIKFTSDSNIILNNRGIIYISFIEGDYNKSGYEYGNTEDPVYVYYHNEEFIKNQLKSHNFEIVKCFRKEYNKNETEINFHIILIAQKAGT